MMVAAHAKSLLTGLALAGALVTAGSAASGPALAAEGSRVQEVVSASGVRAYLVTAETVPALSLSLHFRGGAAYDPPDRSGLAYMTAGLLDEGAGDYDSQAFRAELEDNAIRLSFDADRDGFTGELKTLTRHRDKAFELLRLALTEPRFDEEPVERVRSQILADLQRRETDANYVAARTWFAQAFEAHPYGRPTRGTAETIARITARDMRDLVRDRLARGNLSIGVSGDITAEELGPLLDRTFGALPAEPALAPVAPRAPATGGTVVVEMDQPQSVVTFGHAGIERHDPDYYAAYVANYILGGGGFASRLTEEVREKRGLAYSVYSYLYETLSAPLWLGGVATGNERVAESIAIVRAEVARLAQDGVSEQELADAKTYLTGSFPLRLTSNDQVARTLVGMMVHDLGQDYIDRRNDLVEAVSLEDVNRVARRLFDEELLVTVVGAPEGLDG